MPLFNEQEYKEYENSIDDEPENKSKDITIAYYIDALQKKVDENIIAIKSFLSLEKIKNKQMLSSAFTSFKENNEQRKTKNKLQEQAGAKKLSLLLEKIKNKKLKEGFASIKDDVQRKKQEQKSRIGKEREKKIVYGGLTLLSLVTILGLKYRKALANFGRNFNSKKITVG